MNANIPTELFGADWCEKTSALKEFLELQAVTYIFHNVDANKEAEEKVKNLNEGKVKIPMVIIKNSILKNPSISFLDQKLVENRILDPS